MVLSRAGVFHWAALMTTCFVAAGPVAQAASSPSDSVAGRVELDFVDAPPAAVEVDLTAGILGDISGIGQAAIAGLVDALLQSAEERGGESVEMTAEQLEVAQDVVETVTGLLHELRVRVYELEDGSEDVAEKMMSHYQDRLRSDSWDNFIRVRDGDENVNASLIRDDGAIRGVFLMVGENDNVVIVNAVCDLSPDRVHHVTNQLAKIGLQFGLENVLEQVLEEIREELQ